MERQYYSRKSYVQGSKRKLSESKFSRIIICGGRDFKDRDFIYGYLNFKRKDFSTNPIFIHGAATGADTLGGQWAKDMGFRVEEYPAKWDDLDHPDAVIKTRPNGRKYNVMAGFMRNTEMLLTKPDLVIAFPGGNGTNHMIAESTKAGVKVIKLSYKK